jgi:hypothetical protein
MTLQHGRQLMNNATNIGRTTTLPETSAASPRQNR